MHFPSTTRPFFAGAGRLAAVALGAVLLGSTLGGCASSGGPDVASTVRTNVVADDRTHQIAKVEFERQCVVGTQSFPKESDIDADLAKRLTAAGLSHLEWKEWHDSLVTSPDLVTQLAAVGRAGCPKA